jgi:hypothetical protein
VKKGGSTLGPLGPGRMFSSSFFLLRQPQQGGRQLVHFQMRMKDAKRTKQTVRTAATIVPGSAIVSVLLVGDG